MGRLARRVATLVLLTLVVGGTGTAQEPDGNAKAEYAAVVQPLLKTHCLDCHSAAVKKGSLDLERFASVDLVRKDLLPWQQLIEQLEADEMPPKDKPQPTAAERKQMVDWTRRLLDAEARARAGDPGHVPLRRLSNTEYDSTIRDLTGVDLRPTREFPADGAAGEGFTNAAESLADISPTLLSKYLNAARDIAEHAVLLPDGFRFSPTKTRRDWTDESTARLRGFYNEQVGGDGRLQVQRYLEASVRHRDAILGGKVTPDDVAAKEKLNPKYFGVLWHTLQDKTPSYLLDGIRDRWRAAAQKDVPALAGEITALQTALWKTARVGSYVRKDDSGVFVLNPARQVAFDSPAVESVPLRVTVKPAPGQTEVVLSLASREMLPAGGGNVVWHRPRFEAAGKPPLLLRDYAEFGPAFEVDSPPVLVGSYGLAKDRFGTQPGGKAVDEASLVAAADSVTEVRLPIALFVGREFVVDGRLDDAAGERVVQFRVLTECDEVSRDRQGAVVGPSQSPLPDGRGSTTSQPLAGQVVASPESAAFKRLIEGNADFRRVFPMFLCFPQVIPNDEVVCLKMFHREDEPLARLFLNDEQQRRLDHLWNEHQFISRQSVAELNYLPLFMGFVTQDQPKALFDFFEAQRPSFQGRADELLKSEEAHITRQLEALLEFAGRAYRRPLSEKDRTDLLALYSTIRGKEQTHEEAFHHLLARVLVSPAFLFRIEQAPAGKERRPINDWELATRLSYFLWSSTPDDELRQLAAAGRLSDPPVLAEQVRRMLKDDRLRALAIEFGTQWIHVRGFDEFKEKNETLFPTFNANFRKAVYEESILFFQDLFQSDRAVTQILDADYTFLNESLAKHYGIPGVSGPQWRRVDGVKQFGRGGVLGLASVQARQAGASRSSPLLRGNWVVETLLGEKLPRPPADVPRLPEEEGTGGLTMRQQVEQHAKSASCAACHVRIDPFGFAMEKYDPIGRLGMVQVAVASGIRWLLLSPLLRLCGGEG